MKEIIYKSIVTCPECGFTKEEIMKTDSCLFFYKCDSCKKLLKPKDGDCCVFCSYGTVKCPRFRFQENAAGKISRLL